MPDVFVVPDDPPLEIVVVVTTGATVVVTTGATVVVTTGATVVVTTGATVVVTTGATVDVVGGVKVPVVVNRTRVEVRVKSNESVHLLTSAQ